MSVQDRRLKHKEELRQQILDVSKDIASSDGWQNLTIRKICQKINYTAPVIYQYFENKESILLSLREDGFEQIFSLFDEVNLKYSDAEQRLFEYGLVWWNFSKNNPELYQVMFNLQGAICSENNDNIQSKKVTEYYNAAFKEINEEAKTSSLARLELNDNIIAIVHGFIAMRMVNLVKSGKGNVDKSFRKALTLFINSIKTIK